MATEPLMSPAPTGFLDHLQCEYVDGRVWTVIKPFGFISGKTGLHVIVPEGFETDFASIPRILWRIMPPTDGRIGKGAVIHDFLYRTPSFPISRNDADLILMEAMEYLGANIFQRKAVYAGVRVGGSKAFKPRETK